MGCPQFADAPPLPVLAGLLIEADSEGLTLSSFDYEVSARVEEVWGVVRPASQEKAALMAKTWRSPVVEQMLQR